jgi:hypothetical protein
MLGPREARTGGLIRPAVLQAAVSTGYARGYKFGRFKTYSG